METRFFKDALFRGRTANAVKLGTVMTLGWFWVRIAGCHTMYRGQDGNVDYDHVQAVMNLDGSQVSIANQTLPANTIWHYTRRQASDCGLESADSLACIVRIDANGDMIANTPNPPLDLIAEGAAGAKITLRWRYSDLDEEVSPTGFRIYMDSGSGFDFSSPVGTVSISQRQGNEYEWTSGALSDAQLYRFCVRSYRLDQAGELVLNGGFDTDSDWTKGDGWTINGGKANWDEQSGTGDLEQSLTIVVGRKYRVTYSITDDNFVDWGLSVRIGGADGTRRTGVGTYSEDITAVNSDGVKFILSGEAGGEPASCSIDDVSVTQVAAETQNTDFVAAVAQSQGPAAITGITGSWQEI